MAGNWKMNMNHLQAIGLVQKLAFSLSPKDLDAVEVAVLPPFVDLRSVQTLVDGDGLRLAYGAQDLSEHDEGAYTGEVSGAMLAKLGCTYVVIGHSERRQYHREDDALVNRKVKAALTHGLTPLLCVGEGLDVRELNGQVDHCIGQVERALEGVTAEQARTMVVAYEPVWAIGTGKVATPAGRPGGLRRGPADAVRALPGRDGRPGARAVRRLGQEQQRRRAHAAARRRRRPRGGREPRRRGVRQDLPVPVALSGSRTSGNSCVTMGRTG